MRSCQFIWLAIFVFITGCIPPPPEGEGDAASSSDSEDSSDTGESDAAEPTDEELGDCAKQGAAVAAKLGERCGACHGGGNILGGLGNITALPQQFDKGYLVVGSAEDSLLYQRVEAKEMPLDGVPYDEAELADLRDWIDICTPAEKQAEDISLTEKPQCPTNVALSQQEQLAAIRDDIVLLDKAEARTTRYLSLAHLYGSGYCEAQIEGYRHALIKLLNHLSLSPYIQSPVAIDAARTIYRINLFDYGWSTKTWADITRSDPYRVVFESEDAEDVRALSEVDFFSIKADWFIDAASQPPLYYTILEIPGTRFELEDPLGVDVAVNIMNELNFDRDEVARSGFQESDVSFSNRVIERHQQPTSSKRAYWISYDFAVFDPADPLENKNILENPLDFVQDGGEIIFNLANGLQAYMLVDALGNRIDRGPINVVSDKETPEEPEVIAGLSCISCHTDGMRSPASNDQVAPFVFGNTFFSTKDQEDVAKLYTPPEAFNRLLKQDTETFIDAMEETGALRRVGGREPIMAVHLAFDGILDLRRAAAEFGVLESEVLKNLSSLRALSTIDRATVTRDDFEVNFAFNACILRLGVTFDATSAAIDCQ